MILYYDYENFHLPSFGVKSLGLYENPIVVFALDRPVLFSGIAN
jgi:hypothetical protein